MVDDHRSNKIVVELLGRINKCGVISPRFDISNQVRPREFVVKYHRITKNGQVISCPRDNSDSLSWPQLLVQLTAIYLSLIGVMDHEDARKRHTGGKILGFFYWFYIIQFKKQIKRINWNYLKSIFII